MIKNVDYFSEELEKQRKKYEKFRPANIAYGSNIMPILKMYKSLSTSEEKIYFREALEKLLADPNADKRRFAIEVCVGFFAFSDAH